LAVIRDFAFIERGANMFEELIEYYEQEYNEDER